VAFVVLLYNNGLWVFTVYTNWLKSHMIAYLKLYRGPVHYVGAV